MTGSGLTTGKTFFMHLPCLRTVSSLKATEWECESTRRSITWLVSNGPRRNGRAAEWRWHRICHEQWLSAESGGLVWGLGTRHRRRRSCLVMSHWVGMGKRGANAPHLPCRGKPQHCTVWSILKMSRTPHQTKFKFIWSLSNLTKYAGTFWLVIVGKAQLCHDMVASHTHTSCS